MITEDLVAYIQSQTKKNIPKDTITANLANAGWRSSDITEGFAKLTPVVSTTASTPASFSAPLRIAPVTNPPVVAEKPNSVVSTQEPKVWVPMSVKSPIIQQPNPAPVQQVVRPVAPQQTLTPAPTQVSSIYSTLKPMTPEVRVQAPEPQATIPTDIKTRQVVDSIRIPQKQATVPPSTPMPKGLAVAFGSPAPQEPVVKPPTIASTPVASTVTPPAVVLGTPPPFVIKPTPTSFMPLAQTVPPAVVKKESQPETLTSSINSILGKQNSTTVQAVHAPVDETLPKRAMISSYKQDSLSVNQTVVKQPRKLDVKMIKHVSIGAVAVLLVGGGIFAFAAGYIQIPSFALSIVKEDPQTVLLEAASKFNSVKSYKSDITADLTLPSFATITNGLVSGNSDQTGDVDTVSVSTQGQVTNSTILTPALYDYATTIKSSLLLDDIISTWKYNGTTSYIDVPQLSELFGANAPPPATVAIANGEFGQLLPELSPTVQEMVKKADIYNVVSKGIPPYAQGQIAQAFRTFMGTVTVTEKPDETIHGVSTYHYSIQASRDATKKFLTDMFDVFSIPLSSDTKQNIDEGLGATTLDSFDVWVGKDDSMLHQYQFTLTTPLSKVIALDDKGIAGKVVTLTVKDTFYDLGVSNKIAMPISSITMADFVNSIRDAKIKNIISTFGPIAKSLVNAEGGYGKKANPSGSCLNPAVGSLFSPTGHNQGASSQIGLVASTMDSLLNETDNTGSCYSTPSTWALAVPLSTDQSSYYCADNTGALVTTTTPLSGTICK
jgi:hypothetical protein